jgi:8-oxo-dGTP pyrophosphatase MutT (NUDIX family)
MLPSELWCHDTAVVVEEATGGMKLTYANSLKVDWGMRAMNMKNEVVQRLTVCRLAVIDDAWPFAQKHAAAIDAHFVEATQRNPKLFDGDVFVVNQWSVEDGVLEGQTHGAKFSAYYYWRENNHDGGDTEEAFAVNVVKSCDGGVLLVQAVPGTLNAGQYCAPGGLLDRRDLGSDGLLDLAGAAARELKEETGLSAADMTREPGYLMAYVAPFFGIASVFRSDQTGDALLSSIGRSLGAEAQPEIEAPCMVYEVAELNALPTIPIARLLCEAALV